MSVGFLAYLAAAATLAFGAGPAELVMSGVRDAVQPSSASVSAAPSHCRPAAVRRSAVTFLSDASAGDATGLDASIAGEPRFVVFSTGFSYSAVSPRHFFVTYDRRRLIEKLLHRRAKGDRYRLEALQANGYDSGRRLCNIGFTLLRRIGSGPWRPFVGKGALDAATGAVVVWNIGGTNVP